MIDNYGQAVMQITSGIRLGSFKLLAPLGAGAMGEVWRALDDKLQREVAIKVLPDAFAADSDRLARFQREAQALAALNHPGITAIYDLHKIDGVNFLVMELVEGPTLEERLATGPLPIEETITLLAQIAEALEAAHNRGIVHRDLKPANIKVNLEGRVKILDFGLAKVDLVKPSSGQDATALFQSDASSLTGEKTILGTPAYMSPEQARGKPVDKRADIWAFGCCLYEAIVGQRPFSGETSSDLLASILKSEPDWNALPTNTPANISGLIKRCLAKDPQDRLRDIGDARIELKGHLAATTTASAMATGVVPRNTETGLKAILFTRIEGHKDLRQQLGVEGSMDEVARHDALFQQCLTRFQGTQRDHSPDGFFATFDLPSSALRCGLEFQSKLFEQKLSETLKVSIGIHVGEIEAGSKDGSKTGGPMRPATAIDTAAWVMGLAQPGQILLTSGAFNSARQQLTSAPGGVAIEWLAHGPYLFEGLDNPLEIFEAGIRGVSLLSAPADTETAKSATRLGDEITLGWRPAIGKTIPTRENWILEKNLGEGGFGEVWLARHDKTSDRRVFKFCFEADRLQGLKREVTVIRLIKETLGNREDIAKVLDWNFDRAPFFIEAEYTEGGDLKDWSDQQGGISTVPLESRLELMAQTATALAAAHSVGVIHKDIKAANILIAKDTQGAPKAVLTDFGIGAITDKSLLGDKGILVTGATQLVSGHTSSSGAGTRLYMAPEMLEGKIASTASDIYSLGVLLCQVVRGDLTRALATGWERDIEDELLREDIAACVEGDPEQRLTSAADLAHRLRSLDERRSEQLAEKLALAEAEQALRLATKHRRRQRLFLVMSACGIGVTLLIAWYAARESQRAGQMADLANSEKAARNVADRQAEEMKVLANREKTAREVADRTAEEVKRQQYITTIRYSQSLIASGRHHLAQDELLKVDPSRHNWEWGWMLSAAHPEALTLKVRGDQTSHRHPDSSQSAVGQATAGENPVTVIRYSSDGTKIAAGTSSGDITLWDASTGEKILDLPRQIFAINELAFSADGSRMVTTPKSWVGSASYATLWDITSGQEVATLAGHAHSFNASFSSDGSQILTDGLEGSLIFWDAPTGQQIARYPADSSRRRSWNAFFGPEDRTMVRFSNFRIKIYDASDARLLAEHAQSQQGKIKDSWYRSGSRFIYTRDRDDRTITIWDSLSGDELHHFEVPDGNVEQIISSLNDRRLLVFSENTAWVRDAETGEGIASLDGYTAPGESGGEAISPDGSVALVFDVSSAKIWNTANGSLFTTLTGHRRAITSAVFSPDSRWLVTGSADGEIKVWGVQSLRDNSARASQQVGENVFDAQFNPASDQLLVAALEPDSAEKHTNHPPLSYLWQLGSDQKQTLDAAGTTWGARVHFSPDGSRAITGHLDRSPQIWDVKSGKRIAEIPEEPTLDCELRFIANGSRVVTLPCVRAQTEEDIRRAKVWDAATGQQIAELSGPSNGLTQIALLPDGRQLAGISKGGAIYVWDVETGELLREFWAHEQAVRCANFSPDATQVVTASDDGSAKVWSLENWQEIIALIGHHRPVTFAQFSPDGARVVTASSDGTARVWDVATGRELFLLGGLTRELLSIAWTPDGNRLLTVAGSKDYPDGTGIWDQRRLERIATDINVRIWEMETGHELMTLPIDQSTQAITRTQFSSDGRRLLTLDGISLKQGRLWNAFPWRSEDSDSQTGQDWLARFYQWQRQEHQRKGAVVPPQVESWMPAPAKNAGPPLFTDDFETSLSIERWGYDPGWKTMAGRLTWESPDVDQSIRVISRIWVIDDTLVDAVHYALEIDVELPTRARALLGYGYQHHENQENPCWLLSYTARRIRGFHWPTVGQRFNSRRTFDSLLEDLANDPTRLVRLRMEVRPGLVRVFADGQYVGQYLNPYQPPRYNNGFGATKPEEMRHAVFDESILPLVRNFGSCGFGHMTDQENAASYDNLVVYPLDPR
jgi:serine/threonine protein kinase/WD40 repeat protein